MLAERNRKCKKLGQLLEDLKEIEELKKQILNHFTMKISCAL